MNGYEYVQIEKKGKIGIDQPAQIAVVPHHGSAAVKAGCAAPCKNGKATNSAPDQTKPKKVYQEK